MIPEVREQGSHATGCGPKKKGKEGEGGGKRKWEEREEEEDKEKESLLIINPIKWHLGYTGEERKILSTAFTPEFQKWKVPLHYIQ